MASLLKKLFLVDPLTIGVEGYRSALLYGGENFIHVTAAANATPADQAAALALQTSLRGQYPMLPYILGASVIAVVIAIIGHIIFRRKADLFAEQG